MDDNYTHVDNTVIYIYENIPGPYENSKEYEELTDAYNSQIFSHCSCVDRCVYPRCKCLTIYCSNTVDMQKAKTQNNIIKNTILECNSKCSCSKDCGNRIVQKGPMEGLVIKNCNNGKGFGLFASKCIPSGTFICEYAGELLTKSQAIYRSQYNEMEGFMNYIFCLNEICNGVVHQTFVDPRNFGNIGRYINHSCEPNCQIIPVRYDMPIPKLAIFSSTDILPDMEITFHYGSKDVNNYSSLNKEFVKRKKCLCNSVNCNKYLPYNEY